MCSHQQIDFSSARLKYTRESGFFQQTFALRFRVARRHVYQSNVLIAKLFGVFVELVEMTMTSLARHRHTQITLFPNRTFDNKNRHLFKK